jgi:hypothetical protein
VTHLNVALPLCWNPDINVQGLSPRRRRLLPADAGIVFNLETQSLHLTQMPVTGLMLLGIRHTGGPGLVPCGSVPGPPFASI